ncbi:hypothetical protein BTO32_15295 [Marinobacter lutaoensis]|uniref:Uncharacterized protein n=1 Tax=Marinobacter lutaoensis TaxID=135739 RepID=A0A1V2DQA7_9GAMM|nr:hypothetical protein [Marinobacter lutaoensis]ONF42571.1 hypothetical protein BTO32_15295 [Marinobacter lutaoensis]
MGVKRVAMIMAMFAILVGCGSGDSKEPDLGSSTEAPVPEPVPEPRLFSNGQLAVEPTLGSEIPVGTYQYTSINPDGGDETIGIALVSDSGRMALALTNRLSFARIALDESNRFESPLEDTDTAIAESGLTISGRRDNGVPEGQNPRISGTFVNNDSQTISRNYKLDLQEPDSDILDLDTLAGTFSGTDKTGIGTVFSIGSDGSLIGSGTAGCDYAGQIRIPDAGRDVFEASFVASNCGPTDSIPGASRDGAYFALGRLNNATRSITLFATNGSVALRFTGNSTASEDQVVDEEVPPYTADDFDVEPTIAAKLESGVYSYEDVPLDTAPAVLESGLLFVSDTGRLALVTNTRLAVARIRVNDVDTFTDDLIQSRNPESTESPSEAATIFGTPNNNGSSSNFTIAGSLLNAEEKLENRYRAERDTTNDATYNSSPLTVAGIAGTYSGTRNPGAITTTITISTTGEVTGSDTTGCAFVGNTNINDGRTGIVEMRLTVSNCSASTIKTGAERNGTYNGVGDVVPGLPSTLRLVLGSTTNVEYLELTEQ